MLTGKLKSGKTTLANALIKSLRIKQDSFARPPKAGLKEMRVVTDGLNKDREAPLLSLTTNDLAADAPNGHTYFGLHRCAGWIDRDDHLVL